MRFLLVLVFMMLCFGIVNGNAMNLSKNDFEQKWEELSQDEEKLNEYTALWPVELKNIEVHDRKIDGAIFTEAKFSEIEWENSSSKKSTFTKVVFERCKFTSELFMLNLIHSTFADEKYL
jgi:hypothetical protein